MAKLFKAYISVDALLDAIKTKHSSLFTGKDDKQYLSVSVWLNDKVSEFGTIGNINLDVAKDSDEKHIKIANLKEVERKEPKGELPTPGQKSLESDLPF